MNHKTETPKTDACPLCAATDDCMCFSEDLKKELAAYKNEALCLRDDHDLLYRDYQKLEAEVEELKQQKRNCIEIIDDDAIEIAELKAEVERLSKLTEDCLNVIRVYCPTYYNDAMERFNKTDKAKK